MGAPVDWTAAMDAELKVLWPKYSQREVAQRMGLYISSVQLRAKRLFLPKRTHIHSNKRRRWQPSRAVIEQAYAAQAGPAAPLNDMLVGSRRLSVSVARWRAFQTILRDHPEVSIAGLSRVAGFHHSSILHGLARLQELEAA